jgi:Golgi complex component 7 (COG7).
VLRNGIDLQVLQSLPRVMRDTEILHQEALLLREKMNTVKQEIAKVWILYSLKETVI